MSDSVAVQLVIRNVTDSVSEFTMAPVSFDFFVADSTGALVWRRLHHGKVDLSARIIRIPPGDSVVFSHFWFQEDTAGIAVPRGTYFVQGNFAGHTQVERQRSGC